MDDMIYLWAGGIWCHRSELVTYLDFMPNNYEAYTSMDFFNKFPEEQ